MYLSKFIIRNYSPASWLAVEKIIPADECKIHFIMKNIVSDTQYNNRRDIACRFIRSKKVQYFSSRSRYTGTMKFSRYSHIAYCVSTVHRTCIIKTFFICGCVSCTRILFKEPSAGKSITAVIVGIMCNNTMDNESSLFL